MLPALAAGVTEVEGICAGVSEAQARHGPWPMREIVAHLLGAERLAVGRAVRVLEEDGPQLTTVSWSETVADDQVSMADLVTRLRDQRERTLTRFASLAPEQWRRTGHHPEWGRLSVHRLLSQLVRHEGGHLAELEARRAGR